MPTYTFTREDDGKAVKKRFTFAEYKKIKDGTTTVVDEDGTPLLLEFNPGSVKFTLKDGESGGWPSKVSKEKAYRRNRHQVMGQKQKDHVFTPKMIPNYMGTEAGSWREAQNMAATDRDVDKDIRAGIAKGYNSNVEREAASKEKRAS